MAFAVPFTLTPGQSIPGGPGFAAAAIQVYNDSNCWFTVNGSYEVGPNQTAVVVLQPPTSSFTMALTSTPPQGQPAPSVPAGTCKVTVTEEALSASSPASITGIVDIGTVSGSVNIAGTPNINIAGQAITVATQENQGLLASIVTPAGTGPTTTNVALPIYADAILISNQGGNVRVGVTNHTSGEAIVTPPLSGNSIFPIVAVGSPAANASIDVQITNIDIAVSTTRIIGIHESVLASLIPTQVSVAGFQRSLTAAYKLPNDGSYALAADAPIDSWFISGFGQNGTALNISQAAPPVGQYLVISRAIFTVYDTAGAAPAKSVYLNGTRLGVVTTPAAGSNLPIVIPLHWSPGAATAITVQSDATGGTQTIAGSAFGFTVSVPNS